MSFADDKVAESTSRHRSILVVDDEKLQREQLVDSLSDLDVGKVHAFKFVTRVARDLQHLVVHAQSGSVHGNVNNAH
jgi:CheY-like chemotaxis protein